MLCNLDSLAFKQAGSNTEFLPKHQGMGSSKHVRALQFLKTK